MLKLSTKFILNANLWEIIILVRRSIHMRTQRMQLQCAVATNADTYYLYILGIFDIDFFSLFG